MFIGVYKITNNINGKFYIGRSKDIRERWRHHKSISTWYRKDQTNKLLYRAIKKYGLENFSFDIVKFNNTPEETVLSEYEFIKELKPEYNIMMSIDGLVKHSKETRKKMSKSAMGNKNALGAIRSKETREKMRKSKEGQTLSEEHKKRLHESNRKKVIRISDGREFNSGSEASKIDGTLPSKISKHCRNEVKNPKWKFKERMDKHGRK